MNDNYIYEINIGKKGLMDHIKRLLNEDNISQRWQNLDKKYHNMDFFIDELCPSLRKATSEQEFRKILFVYLAKLEYLENYGFDKIGYAFDITERKKDVTDDLTTIEMVGHVEEDKIIKTFTDGEKEPTDLAYMTHPLITSQHCALILSNLNNPTYWFNVQYYVDKDTVLRVLDGTINLIDLDLDLLSLPTEEELGDYKIDLNKEMKKEISDHLTDEEVKKYLDFRQNKILNHTN